MNKIAIVVDTNSSIEVAEAERLGVYLLQMPVIIDGKEYIEGKDLTYEAFFEMLKNGSEVSTSQPSPEAVISLWNELLTKFDEVIHIPMSSSLSSSCQTAKALAVEFEGRVHVVDNRRISISQRASVLNALALVERGNLTGHEIAERLESEAADNSIYIAVNTLELLKKSGRVTAAGAALASVLSIKPVLTIQGGKLDAYVKCRGMAAAEKAMLKVIDEELNGRFANKQVRVDLAYSGDIEPAQKWLQLAKESFPTLQLELYRLPLSICCHIANGAMAIGISEVYN